MSPSARSGTPRRAIPATLFAATALVAVGIGTAALPAGAQTTATTPVAPANAKAAAMRKAKTFSLELGASLTRTNIKRLTSRDVVVVDGSETSDAQIKQLKAKGTLVLGYLSVGTVESWRPWFDLLKDHRLEALGDWPGEKYTDLTSPDARTALADTITPQLLAKGYDGLFLDNVDMLEVHPEDSAGMLDVVTRISAKVHAAGGVLMAQNGDSIITPYLPLLDGWNREDATGTYDFDAKKYVTSDADTRRSARETIAQVKAAGLLATTTDYYASPTSTAAKRAVRIACKAGAVPFVGNIALTTVSAKPQHC
ncbi:MAG: endo alpha-1,4 polygalactosaminidase [Solirubrobacteraceae bacterium]|nr:endo alpha-1,4 polygalactosaminidase [Patulibacter sp.]